MSRIITVDRDGRNASVQTIDRAAFTRRHRDAGFAWVHIDGREEDAREAILAIEPLSEFALAALVAQETRPRCTLLAHGALINLRGLALNHLSEGQNTQGTTELEKALQMAPDDDASAQALVVVYVRNKEYDKALAKAEQAVRLEPEYAWAYSQRGVIKGARNEYDAAQTRYAKTRTMAIGTISAGLLLSVVLGALLIRTLYRQLGGEPGTTADAAQVVVR